MDSSRPTVRPAGHVVLLGDSIFDNGAYVPGEPDVVAQVRALLPFVVRDAARGGR